MRTAAALVLTASFCCSQASANDDFCQQLKAFVLAPFPTPTARSVEFYWVPEGILGTVKCVHHGVKASQEFCSWLIQNTSREFDEGLPEDFLRCHGFQFPPIPNAEDWKATYSFFDNAGDASERETVLEVRLAQPGTRDDGAVRISVIPKGQHTAIKPLPPFPEAPPD
jgi:hypothetical protein